MAISSPTNQQPDVEESGGRSGIALAVIVACRVILLLDATIVNIALPSMQRGLGFSIENLSWVVNAYALAFGGLLLLGGRAGDILGRRRVFMIGILVFTAASFVGGFATTDWWLVACRAVQGIGAALAAPSTMSLIMTTFREGPRRTRALALYGATGVFGSALGLILGGLLTATTSWRWVLFVNVPIGIIVLLLTPKYIVESEKHSGRFDLGGALLSTVGMGALVYAFINASSGGWTAGQTIAAFAVGVVLLAAFLFTESKVSKPIIPLRLFTDRNRSSAYLILFLSAGAMGAVYFFLAQFVQNVLNLTPLLAGVGFLPMAAIMLPGSLLVTRLLPKFGAKKLAALGALLITVASLWLTQITDTSDYFTNLFGPMVVFGFGLAFLTLPLTVIGVSGVAPEDAGAASSLFNATLQVGGSLGLSILIAVYSVGASTGPKSATGKALADHMMAGGVSVAFVAATVIGLITLALALLIRTPPAAQVTVDDDAAEA